MLGYPAGMSAPVTPKGRRAREALLKAGVAVADRAGLAGLTVAAVSQEAGLAKGTFYLYFADRDAFIDALHQRFYERVNEAVIGAAGDLPDGLEKQLTAIDTYLDVCLENKGVKALVLETRSRPGLTTYMEEREELFARLSEPNFKAMGASNSRVAARLSVAMTSETALIELDAGRRLPAARRTLRQLVTGIQDT